VKISSLKKNLYIPIFLLFVILSGKASLYAATSSTNVVSDPRLELLAVVQSLSGYGER